MIYTVCTLANIVYKLKLFFIKVGTKEGNRDKNIDLLDFPKIIPSIKTN